MLIEFMISLEKFLENQLNTVSIQNMVSLTLEIGRNLKQGNGN